MIEILVMIFCAFLFGAGLGSLKAELEFRKEMRAWRKEMEAIRPFKR